MNSSFSPQDSEGQVRHKSSANHLGHGFAPTPPHTAGQLDPYDTRPSKRQCLPSLSHKNDGLFQTEHSLGPTKRYDDTLSFSPPSFGSHSTTVRSLAFKATTPPYKTTQELAVESNTRQMRSDFISHDETSGNHEAVVAQTPGFSDLQGHSEHILDFDDYDIDPDFEGEMIRLLDTTTAAQEEHHMAPTSVMQTMDRLSRELEDFDPNLQHSPPTGADASSETVNPEQDFGEKVDLMDSEIDWDEVMASIPMKLPEDSEHGPREPNFPQTSMSAHYHENVAATTNTTQQTHPFGTVPPQSQPFTRPPFPSKMRDKSLITGISSQTITRTCFRMGEFINEGVRCFRSRQKAVFEFFARVSYSRRESHARVQHFQFVDLFKEQPPYVSGTLSNWKVDSLLDKRSRDFLNRDGLSTCRCVCELRHNPTVEPGWTVLVLSISATDWDEVAWMRRIVCSSQSPN